MNDVKRYEAVHLRYDDNNIRYGEGCEVEVVLASDYAALEAERDVLDLLCQERFDELAMLKAELAKLRAGQGVNQQLLEALEFYARGDHLVLFDADEWDTCSGEPLNWLHDNAGTASVEDGSLAEAAIDAARKEGGKV